MSRERKGSRKKTSHATRNILVFGLVVIAVVVAAALLSASSGPQFFMTVHVYSGPAEYASFDQLPANVTLVEGSTVTIAGPKNFAPEATPTGVLGIRQQIPGGNYTITASKAGYNPRTIVYLVGSGCTGKQILPDGNIVCHALVRITNSTSTQ